MISPVFVVMLSGGILAAVPTTSSPFARIRPRTEDEDVLVVAVAHPVATASTTRARTSLATRTSARLHEFLQAAQPGRVRVLLVAVPPVGERHLADVDVAPRIDSETVGRHELARLEPGGPIPESR